MRIVRRPRTAAARCAGLLTLLTMGVTTGCLPSPGLLEGGDATPRVGQCYDTPDAVLPAPHDPTAPVDCAEPHTLQTFAVLESDGPLDRRTTTSLGAECVDRVASFLGGDPQHTAVGVYYFTPTPEAQEDGERWVRCDAAVVSDTTMAGARPVTGSLEGAFGGGVPRDYRRCLEGRPDPSRPQALVPCHRPHQAQQLPRGVDLEGGRAYPGSEALTEQANHRCSQRVSAALPEAASALVVVPTPAMWAEGARTAQCWALASPGQHLGGSETQTT